MIVSASYRTDIPAYWGRWFMDRLAAGEVTVRNPYGGRDYVVSLRSGDVDGFVFWTKNAAPFEGALADIAARGSPFVVQYTVTGYGSALEDAAPDASRSIAVMKRLREACGPYVVVWRYDPVVTSSITTAAWHRENFARLAGALHGVTDEVVISFAHIYAKTRRGLTAAADAHGFSWTDPPDDEKRALTCDFAAIAADQGMRLTICSQPGLLSDGIDGAACIDAARLSDVAGYEVRARRKANRPGCLCAESRDIGAYDTCPMGCAYCYAVTSRSKAQQAVEDLQPGRRLRARGAAP